MKAMKNIIILSLLILFIDGAFAQNSWTLKSNSYVEQKMKKCKVNPKIKAFSSWETNIKKVKNTASKAKLRIEKVDDLIIELPSIEGGVKHFKVYLPDPIKNNVGATQINEGTYLGICVEDKNAKAEFNFNGGDFHCIITSKNGSVFFIEPYCSEVSNYYITYLASDIEVVHDKFTE